MDPLPRDPEASRLCGHRFLLCAVACAFSSTVSLSNPRVPYGRGFTCANISEGALTTLGRRDIPPHREGFKAGQELRPREKAE
jgi:hypothetical protein